MVDKSIVKKLKLIESIKTLVFEEKRQTDTAWTRMLRFIKKTIAAIRCILIDCEMDIKVAFQCFSKFQNLSFNAIYY